MVLSRILMVGLGALTLCAQTRFFPLAEVRPGLKGTGRTVFSGDRIEEFQVEILGVLENTGPKQSLILARLSGGPLDRAGVMQGMSGSPVYVDGRLLGAVALSFQFSSEPIAGIRPIEEMVREPAAGAPKPSLAAFSWPENDLTRFVARRTQIPAGESRLIDIATPLSFSGFTRNTLEHFAPQLRSLGMEPLQGVSGGGRPGGKPGDPSTLKPGSMITVQLMTGDLAIGADGTVTHIDGKKVYAFGHRFLAEGDTELPFARAEVLALVPNLATSFKISTAREWMGAMTEDRSAAIAGELGRACPMVPALVKVLRHGARAPVAAYRMEMANDRTLTPFLLQMAVFSAVDATERTLGSSSFSVQGQIEFQGGAPPIKIRNMYAGEFNLPAQVSLAAAVPLSYALQSGFDSLKVRSVALDIEAFDAKKQAQIDQVLLSRNTARPGEDVELTVLLTGENGSEMVRKASYRVPVGAAAGPLYFTVADGNTTNFMEYRNLIGAQPRSVQQIISFLNALRANTQAYVRVWRPDPSFQIQGEDLPNPPASVSLILGRSPGAVGGTGMARNSKLAELVLGAGDVVVTGSKTVQVEIRE